MSQIEFGNREKIELMRFLKKASKETDSKIWLTLIEQLSKPKRNHRIINLNRIDRFTKEGEIIIVPGKVLGIGSLNHSVSVGALSFSKEAARKIQDLGGKCLTIPEIYELKKSAADIKIIG
jgi:large subunit ribosomal protein L18e